MKELTKEQQISRLREREADWRRATSRVAPT